MKWILMIVDCVNGMLIVVFIGVEWFVLLIKVKCGS